MAVDIVQNQWQSLGFVDLGWELVSEAWEVLRYPTHLRQEAWVEVVLQYPDLQDEIRGRGTLADGLDLGCLPCT